MEELRGIIAANIQALRSKSGMTQQELGIELNYTDKAVSKWERGESVPDVGVLLKIARLFGVTLDFIVTDHKGQSLEEALAAEAARFAPAAQECADEALVAEGEFRELVPVVREQRQEANDTVVGGMNDPHIGNLAALFGYKKQSRFTVALMSAACVWLIAAILYVVLSTFVPSYGKAWCCLLFAVPASILVFLIFTLLWGNMLPSFTLMSALLWTGLASVFIFFLDRGQNWVLFLIGVPAQLLLLLWSKMYRKHSA